MKHLFFVQQGKGGRALQIHWEVRVLNILFLSALVMGMGFLAFFELQYPWQWGFFVEYGKLIWKGWWLTLGISFAALGLSFLIGLALVFGQRSSLLLLRYFCRGYIELVRGTPLLVQILTLWYVIFHAVRLPNEYRIPAGILILAWYSGAYLAEILRSGLESVGESQLESAKAIGLTPRQIFRYVVWPQALRQILPPLAGQFATLIKDSSLLSVISIMEFTRATQDAMALSYASFEGFLPLALGYLALTLPISMWSRWLESQVKFER